MPWNWEAAEFILALATVVFSTLGGIIARAIRANSRRLDTLEQSHAESREELRSEARKEVRAIELQLERKVEDHDREISALKAAQITHEDLGRIYRRLDGVVESVNRVGTDLTAKVSVLEGELTATRGQAELVYGYLLKRDQA